MNNVLLSIITVVKNDVANIKSCIESVLAQKYSNFEYIIIDGDSNDGTFELINSYKGKISYILSEPDKGIYDAMNKGIKLSKGKFIHFLNSDDKYFSPKTLKRLELLLQGNKMFYGKLIYKGENKSFSLGQSFDMKRELKFSTVPQPTLFVPRSLYNDIGFFSLKYKIASDYDMVIRLTKKFPIRFVNIPTTIMSSGGISDKLMLLTFKEAKDISIHHGNNFFSTWIFYIKRIIKYLIKDFFIRNK